MRCKPPKVILAEARELVADGAVELHLIGQDTTSYGLGADPFDGGLAALLRALNGVDGLEWIRLMYVYPSVMTDAIIDAVELPDVLTADYITDHQPRGKAASVKLYDVQRKIDGQ